MYKVIQEYHVQKAKVIQQALENLQIAFRTGYAENIVATYDSSLISYQHLKPAEIRLFSSQQFCCRPKEDDSELLKVYAAMQNFCDTPALFFFLPIYSDDMNVLNALADA